MFGVIFSASYVESDCWFVANDPGVVARGNGCDVTGAEIEFGAITHFDMHAAGDLANQV